jgi:hypothetical protein
LPIRDYHRGATASRLRVKGKVIRDKTDNNHFRQRWFLHTFGKFLLAFRNNVFQRKAKRNFTVTGCLIDAKQREFKINEFPKILRKKFHLKNILLFCQDVDKLFIFIRRIDE